MTVDRFARPALGLLLLVMAQAMAYAAERPPDPLEDTEILQAAQLLPDGGAAQPGTVFQSIELREPAKAEVLAFTTGDTLTRRATVFYRQNKRSYRSEINLTAGSYSPPQLITGSDGQLGLTITEVSDFTFLFSDNRVLQALAARGFESAEDGVNFSFDGNFLSWQKWRMHVRFERRAGPGAITESGVLGFE